MYDVEVSLVVLAARGASWMVDPFNMILALLCGVLGFRRAPWLAPAGLTVLAAAGICAYVNHQRDSLGLTPSLSPILASAMLSSLWCSTG